MRIPRRTRVTVADGNGYGDQGGKRREFCLSRALTLALCGLVLVSWVVAGFLVADAVSRRDQTATIAELQKQLSDARLEALNARILQAELVRTRRLQDQLLVMLGVARPDSLKASLGDTLRDLPTRAVPVRGGSGGGAAAAPEVAGPKPARWPAAGTIIREFTAGDPDHGIAAHPGVDIAGPSGARVVAAAEGVVDFVGEDAVLGNYLEIRHGVDYTTVYGHCESVRVGPGATVRAGEQVAKMGRTGQTATTQLYFEVWHRGEAVDPRKVLAGEPPAR